MLQGFCWWCVVCVGGVVVLVVECFGGEVDGGIVVVMVV